MSTASASGNPYVGPHPFQPDQRHLFFGRDHEAGELLALIIANRLVLFFAQSGAGKTSLLNARVLPELASKKFEVLPVGRVTGERPDHVAVDNIFVFNLISYLSADALPEAAMAHARLTDFLGRLAHVNGRWAYQEPLHADAEAVNTAVDVLAAAAGSPGITAALVEHLEISPRILIIDQFEEILTAHPEAWEQRTDFFLQIRQALEDDPYLWVLLAMREDFVGALSPYAHLLPDGLRTRYYMQPMDETAALMAVRKPAALYGHAFASGVAELLTKNLRQIEDPQPQTIGVSSGGMRAAHVPAANGKLGQYVEPVQLQVVCRQLWDSLRSPPGTPITTSDLEKLAGGAGPEEFVNDALRVYYDQTLALALKVAPPEVSERTLRNWFDQMVITREGKRSLVHQTDDDAEGMPNTVIKVLVDCFILRRETRNDRRWIELAHDRFVEPIRRSNRQWFAREPSSTLNRAELWLNSGRDPALLLTNHNLADAATHHKTHPNDFLPLEHEFIEASEEAAQQAARRAADKRRNALVVALVLVMAVAVGVAVMWSREYQARHEADAAKLVAQVAQATTAAALDASKKSELAAEAAGLALRSESLLDSPQLALLLAAQASAIQGKEDDSVAPAVERALHRVLGATGGMVIPLADAEPQAVAISENGQLAVGDDSGVVRIWEAPNDNHLAPRLLPPMEGPVRSLAFTPDGDKMVSLDARKIQVWDLTSPMQTSVTIAHDGERVWAMALLTDALAAVGPVEDSAGGLAGQIRIWDIDQLAKPPRAWVDPSGPASLVVFSRDGRYLVAGVNEGAKGTVRVWDLAASPVVSQTLTASTMLFWGAKPPGALPESAQELAPAVADSQVRALAVSPSTDQFAVSWDDGTIAVHDLLELREAAAWDGPPAQEYVELAFLPSGGGLQLVGAYAGDNRVWMWDLPNPSGEPMLLRGHEGEIRRLAANTHGILVTAGERGEVRVWAQDSLVYEPRLLFHAPGPIAHMSTASDGNSMAVAIEGDPLLHVLSPDGGGPALALSSSRADEVTAAAFADEDTTLLAGTGGGALSSWDVTTGALHWTVAKHSQRINDIAVSPTADVAATASDDGTVRLWNTNSGVQIAALTTSTSTLLLDVAFKPDGALLAAAGADGLVHLWDTAGNRELEPLGADTGPSAFTCLAFSSSVGGTELAAAKDDGHIWRWDLGSRAALSAPVSGEPVSTIAYDGRHLMTAHENGDIRLWYLDAMDALPTVLQGHMAVVRDLAVDPKREAYLLSAAEDGTVRRWDLDIDELAARACQGAGRLLRSDEWIILRELAAGSKEGEFCAEWNDQPQ